ncbi:unnamed protein product [Acanthosepion pharaonis]|uniref:Uncharacterized protein n=1 Tax=Acanthosepion pharaonis TaxID=158019 RepID=A0A812CIV3_ACAPH|nr:unnamed protein product [Sepia pharaonis]
MERLKKVCEGKTRCCGTANTKLLGNSTCPENDSQKLRVTYECIRIDAESIFEKQKEDDKCHKIRFKVSSSFGEITSETVQKMDKNLILMIGDSLPRIKQISLETYDGIVEYMKDIPSLEIVSNSTKKRTGSYASSSDGLTDLISRTKSKYEAITWYNNFIKNKQIINDAHIDIEFLAEVMTETGVYVKSLESFFFDKVKEVIQEVDISILRFPDIENPYFLVYHIKIMAWRVSERLLMYEQTAGGLQGLFQSIKFKPNTKYLSSLEPDIIKSAKEEAEKIFD